MHTPHNSLLALSRRSTLLSLNTPALPSALVLALVLFAPHSLGIAITACLLGTSVLFSVRAAWLGFKAMELLQPGSVSHWMKALAVLNTGIALALIGAGVWRVSG
jgi:hypothetical protein